MTSHQLRILQKHSPPLGTSHLCNVDLLLFHTYQILASFLFTLILPLIFLCARETLLGVFIFTDALCFETLQVAVVVAAVWGGRDTYQEEEDVEAKDEEKERRREKRKRGGREEEKEKKEEERMKRKRKRTTKRCWQGKVNEVRWVR